MEDLYYLSKQRQDRPELNSPYPYTQVSFQGTSEKSDSQISADNEFHEDYLDQSDVSNHSENITDNNKG